MFEISIHAPLTGSDIASREQWLQARLFQSTLPLRGATISRFHARCYAAYFNPRSPYGERPVIYRFARVHFLFQSTLPLRGATNGRVTSKLAEEFQSTLPLRGATPGGPGAGAAAPDFNPRSPYGERPLVFAMATARLKISIHAPLTGSDNFWAIRRKKLQISIHAPLTGSDLPPSAVVALGGNFNPRSPYGERLWM